MKSNYLIPSPSDLQSLFGDFERVANGLFNTSVEKFPFFNVYNKVDTDEVDTIELAVAGFKPSELEVYEEHDLLIVAGNKDQSVEVSKTHWQAFRGISTKSFKRAFKLHGATVDTVDLENGILTITLKPSVSTKKRAFEIVAK